MNKKYIIRLNEEISQIVKKGKKSISKFFIIYKVDNNYDYSRFCISVSKKLGHAYERNYMKRKIKDILMKNKIDFSSDYVIIVRKEALLLSYGELSNAILKLIKGEDNEK